MKNGKTIRILAAAILLSLLMTALPSTPALAAPVITISPELGAAGTMVTIAGMNFESYRGDEVYIFFDDDEIPTSPLVVPQAGSFSFSFNIPGSAVPGKHWMKVKTESTTLASAMFTVPEIEIELDVVRGPVGTRVTIDGKGFAADKVVTFYYYNRARETLGSKPATSTGEFSYTFTVPDSPTGTHRIAIENAEGDSAEATFKVLPLVVLNPLSGAVGAILAVSGTGFGSRRDIAIYFKYDEVAYAKTDEYGRFEVASFNVPTVKQDTYYVTVEDENGSTAKIEFTVVAEASLDKATGSVGTELFVSGTGFTVGRTVAVRYDDVVVVEVTADNDGAFQATFQVPAGRYGRHTITVTDEVNTRQFVFIMESEAPPVPGLLLPGDNQEVMANVNFDWQNVTDDSPPVTYHLQVARDEDFTSIVREKENLTDSEYALSGVERLTADEKETPYYWRVKATDGASNESQWSTPRLFFMATLPAPVLRLPETGTKVDPMAYFDWEDVTNLSLPMTYHLQVASDEDFTAIVLEKEGLFDSEYVLSEEEELAATKKESPYYWRVKAVDKLATAGKWSTPGLFYVGFTFALPGFVVYTAIGFGVLVVGFLAFWLGRRTAYVQE
ncbi:MAG: hypothetical protein QF906_02235 [Dehalococcoidales bacterium]|nr:hypothetical protein [Dehalococcoidales bacterium]